MQVYVTRTLAELKDLLESMQREGTDLNIPIVVSSDEEGNNFALAVEVGIEQGVVIKNRKGPAAVLYPHEEYVDIDFEG